LFLAQVKFSSFVLKGCFLVILGSISTLTGQNAFKNTLIPAPQQFFAAGALRAFDTIIVQHNTTLIPAQAVPIIASLLNPKKKNFPRKEKINDTKRTLYLDVGLVKFAEEGYDMEMRGDRLLVWGGVSSRSDAFAMAQRESVARWIFVPRGI
jgi:hypothetical protein